MSLAQSLVKSVEEDGYDVLIVIGFGFNKEAKYMCRIGMHPLLRSFTDEQRDAVLKTVRKIFEAPLDDLERRSL